MNQVWLTHYQQGVPYSINVNEYTSLVELFNECCEQYASRKAFENLGQTITFKELEEKSRYFAAYLQQLNLKEGARIAIMMPNLIQYPIALFGILRAGYIVVNTNPLYTCSELVQQMNDSGAEVIIALANFASTVEKALPHTQIKHVVITKMGDSLPIIKAFIVNSIVKYIKKLIPNYQLPQSISFKKALTKGQETRLKTISFSQQTIAFLQYTGGTTGVAKGAILTHGNIIANILQAFAWIPSLLEQPGQNKQDIVVTALPLYHIFSLTANCFLFLKMGAKNILITNPRDTNRFVKTIKHSRFTAITGVNTLFNALLNHPRFHEIDFSHLKLALSGGMPLQKSVALQWMQRTQTRILEAYGLTETSPAVTINPLYLEKYNGSIGLPLPSTDVSIRDKDENEVNLGVSGELCIKGPQVMQNYWNQPQETALVFTADGFLKTGDIAYMDEKGFIYLIDRKKDMIDVSGFNVYPNEVEQVIAMHPGVLEVGVIGVADFESGEKVKACIVRRDPHLTAEEIISHCRKYLTAYKIPKLIEFYIELPKTNVGKILRRALKGQADTLAEKEDTNPIQPNVILESSSAP